MSSTTLPSQPMFYLESLMETPEAHSLTNGNVVAFSRRCPGKDEPNDDCAAMVETKSGAIVLVVADGVGGCPMGYKASAITVQAVVESVQAADTDSNLRSAILDGIEQANAEILDLGVGAATTVSVVSISDGVARTYQVGDSMTLIFGQRGALRWKSITQSPVGYAVESGLMDEIEGMHHEDRHLVSNLVGIKDMHIQIGPPQELSARDTIIVASDGLFDNLLLDEVIALGKSGKPIDRMDDLVALASNRMHRNDRDLPGKPDDLSVLLYTA
ncbi:MAG: PP2C family serine/threonine-protein phosphatase [Rubripirellula sp.]